MAMSWLRRLAAADAVPVFPVIGRNGLRRAEDLALDPRVAPVPSPRQAAVLMVVGEPGADSVPELSRVHDQLPHPRATVWWRADPVEGLADPIVVTDEDDPLKIVAGAYGALMEGARRSEADLLPDEPPAPWRGEGDHGQGGEGMMGGKPYGRPMAMTGDDLRDGLALDAYTATFGPFLPTLPPGLTIEATLQGDVIQSAALRRRPFAQEKTGEREACLRNLARMLRLLGLEALSGRCFRAARTAGGAAWRRRPLTWSLALRAIPRGLGAVGDEDVRARVSAWLEQGAGTAEPAAAPPAPPRLVELLPGLEWHEAMLVINSFGQERLQDMCPVDAGKDGGSQ